MRVSSGPVSPHTHRVHRPLNSLSPWIWGLGLHVVSSLKWVLGFTQPLLPLRPSALWALDMLPPHPLALVPGTQGHMESPVHLLEFSEPGHTLRAHLLRCSKWAGVLLALSLTPVPRVPADLPSHSHWSLAPSTCHFAADPRSTPHHSQLSTLGPVTPWVCHCSACLNSISGNYLSPSQGNPNHEPCLSSVCPLPRWPLAAQHPVSFSQRP